MGEEALDAQHLSLTSLYRPSPTSLLLYVQTSFILTKYRISWRNRVLQNLRVYLRIAH